MTDAQLRPNLPINVPQAKNVCIGVFMVLVIVQLLTERPFDTLLACTRMSSLHNPKARESSDVFKARADMSRPGGNACILPQWGLVEFA